MLIDVRSHGFTLTGALLRHVEQQVESSLGWARHKIYRVEVHLRDINGDHGGEDKSCQFVVRLRPLKTLVISAVSRDLYAAVGQVALRAKERLSRQVHRTMERGRRQSVRQSIMAWR